MQTPRLHPSSAQNLHLNQNPRWVQLSRRSEKTCCVDAQPQGFQDLCPTRADLPSGLTPSPGLFLRVGGWPTSDSAGSPLSRPCLLFGLQRRWAEKQETSTGCREVTFSFSPVPSAQVNPGIRRLPGRRKATEGLAEGRVSSFLPLAKQS